MHTAMNTLLDIDARPVIGHRGNRAQAPENTLESISQAVALGVDAVEFDVRVSRDGKLLVMHDPTLERTTNGSGFVNAYTLHELQQLDAGANFTPDNGRSFPWRNRGIVVPSFDEIVETVRELPMIIELKTPAATELIRAAIAKHNLSTRVIVAGFNSAAVHPLRGAGFALGATTRDSLNLLPRAFVGLSAPALEFQTVNIPPTWHGLPVPFAKLVRSLRAGRTPIHVWTINDAAEAHRLWRTGVNGIISDDPAVILAARAAFTPGRRQPATLDPESLS